MCDFPEPDAALRDETLEAQMALTRQVVGLGRAARNSAKVKTRQPLQVLQVKHPGDGGLPEELEALAYAELNVKAIEYVDSVDDYLVATVEADRGLLGPKFGGLTPKIYEAVRGSDANEVAQTLKEQGVLHLNIGGEEVSLTKDEVKVSYQAKDGFSAAYDDTACVVLDLTITDELRREGYARELIRTVQELRKKADFQVSDRIELYVSGDDTIGTAIEHFLEKIKSEVLAQDLHVGPVPDSVEYQAEQKVNDVTAMFGLTRKS